MCVGDLAQKWEKNAIWFESQVRIMIQVKRVNDLNQDPRTNKNLSHDSNQAFYDSSHMIWVNKTSYSN